MGWFCLDRGQGRPLVLLHGIGMSHQAWAPILARLAQERRVLAFDIAGFGRTPPLAGEVSAQTLVAGLRDSLHEIGIDEPVDLVGNSMGGWLALEAAKAGLARSVVVISPAGLGRHQGPSPHIRATFALTRFAARRLPRLSQRLLRSDLLRTLALAVPMTARGWRIPAYAAELALADFGQAPGFDATLEAIKPVAELAALTLPLTIAFGRLDALLVGDYQSPAGLPPQTRWLRPLTWGHVPMWEDPAGVARVILEGTA